MKKILFFSAIAGLIGSMFSTTGCAHKAAAEERDSTYTTIDQPDWSRNAVIYEVNWRQMTPEGTLTALTDQLPRLKDLGVDILWMMPIHPISELNRKGTLGSYYAVRDYCDVNPELGTLDEFKEFVKKAHEMGFKVIIDWVPNHTGCDNAWVTEHPEYYALNEEGQMYGPFDWSDVYKLDYSKPETRRAMTDALKFWLTEVDIDGFRCDVAAQVPTDYWNEARPELEAAKPGVFMLAEALESDLLEHAFNMNYNWPMKDVFNSVAMNAGQYHFGENNIQPLPVAAIDSLLAVQAQEDPKDSYRMNMITNHDLNSWEGTEFQRFGNLVGAMAVLSYTLPGMPLIYTGQETGMDRAFEFFEKDQAPEFEPRNDYFAFYQKLNALKHGQAALAAGTAGGPIVRYATESPNVYAFSREVEGSKVLVVANLGGEEEAVVFTADAPALDGMTNYFTGEAEEIPATLASGEYRVYTK